MTSSDQPTVREISFTPAALRNIHNMLKHVQKTGWEQGLDSKEYQDMVWSLVSSLEAVFGLGGSITAEDELSLYGVSFIHYGMVYHHHTKTWSVHS